jgi:transcriptional repressor NrdR
MRCPKCTSIEDKVIDSRISKEGNTIRRRRECHECGLRFTTTEMLVRDGIAVIKRDGRREELSRLKLMSGIMRACEKRPVSPAQIEALVDEVLDEIEQTGDAEVTSSAIGEKVVARLEKLDQVAYVRFASVYKRFADVNQFLNAIQGIVGRTGEAPAAPPDADRKKP